jgi:hypothetical protein
MALKGKTPREWLAEKLKSHVSNKIQNMLIRTVQEVG